MSGPAPTDKSWVQQPGSEWQKNIFKTPPVETPIAHSVPEDAIPPGKVRLDQTRKMFAVWNEYVQASGMTDESSKNERKRIIKDMFGLDSSTKMDERQADELIAYIETLKNAAEVLGTGPNDNF